MSIAFGQLKEQIGSAVGKCSEDKKQQLAIDLLKYLCKEGKYGVLKRWKVWANDCNVTLPADLDTPKKVKVNGNPRPVFNFWHEFNDIHSFDDAERYEGRDNWLCDYETSGIRLDPSTYGTAYDLPSCGGYVYFAPLRIPGAPLYVEKTEIEGTVHGLESSTNTEVTLAHNDSLRRGEILNISTTEPKYSTIKYREITNVIKPQTLNRIGLYWSPNQYYEEGEGGLLAELDPFETRGSFRRIYVPELKDFYKENLGEDYCCNSGVCLVILGTVKVKEYYDDNEILPFDLSGFNVKLIAKYLHAIVNASNSDEMNVALQQKSIIEDDIDKEWDKKTSYASPINVINFRHRKLTKIH